MEQPDDIALLEERIEQVSISIERCRKVSLASKIAVAVGLIWIALTLLQLATFNPTLTFGALALAIGGVVLLGSNSSTWDQLQAARLEAQTQRDELIGALPLRLVGEEHTTRH